MRRMIALCLLAAAVVIATPMQAESAEVLVADLVDDGRRYADSVVTVVGELIGDYGNRRNGFTWTQLNQDPYVTQPIAEGGPPAGGNVGIGVRIPSQLLEAADRPGRYRQVGPIVVLTGVWKFHDPARQGESYLAVEQLEVVRAGRPLPEEVDWWPAVVGVALLLAAAALLTMRRRARPAH